LKNQKDLQFGMEGVSKYQNTLSHLTNKYKEEYWRFYNVDIYLHFLLLYYHETSQPQVYIYVTLKSQNAFNQKVYD
jgi:hypothetical protein